MHPLSKLRTKLESLESEGLLRYRSARPVGEGSDDESLIDVCSNDYLGYGRTVSRETIGAPGAGASRLIRGTTESHEALEFELASWVRLPDSLVFSSGYAANVGLLAALAGPGDVIVSDELNHASIIDGCRLSGARVVIVPHRDIRAFERALATMHGNESAWVVTESYFSMDGDSPDLAALRGLCDERNAALYVDEAHALGVFGPEGGGLCRAAGVAPDVLVGTLGKAVGTQGAFAAGRTEVLDFVWNRARSFVFSTAVSPMLADLSLQHVRRARADDAARQRLRSLCAKLRELLGTTISAATTGPIFPIVVGSPERALRGVEVLREHGFAAVAIRPPTVPAGSSRLRISLNAKLGDQDVFRLGDAIVRCLGS